MYSWIKTLDDKKLEEFDRRILAVEQCQSGILNEIKIMEVRREYMNKRFNQVDARFNKIDSGIAKIFWIVIGGFLTAVLAVLTHVAGIPIP